MRSHGTQGRRTAEGARATRAPLVDGSHRTRDRRGQIVGLAMGARRADTTQRRERQDGTSPQADGILSDRRRGRGARDGQDPDGPAAHLALRRGQTVRQVPVLAAARVVQPRRLRSPTLVPYVLQEVLPGSWRRSPPTIARGEESPGRTPQATRAASPAVTSLPRLRRS